MRPVDTAIVCPVCGERSKSKVAAFEHERPHLEAIMKNEELELLRRIVVGLIKSAGRETTGDSYELDYCWDLAEEYVRANYAE